MLRRAISRHPKDLKKLLDSSSMAPNIVLARLLSGRPFNTVINFVPQQEAWIVERFGKFSRTLQPGINVVWPFLEKIKYVQVLKELVIEVPSQHAITADNVTLEMDGVLYLRITDPYKASYGVEDAEFAVTQLAQTTMRSEIGKIPLDHVFKDRESLNYLIVEAMNKASDAWGINCLRYEIRDIKLPEKVRLAMQMQVEAERKKRANVLESEGIRAAEINVAEGRKKARVLNSEAHKSEKVNQATGEAQAQIARAEAQAVSVKLVAAAISKQNGYNAVSVQIAEQYVKAFGNLAKTGNTVLLPTNTGDISSMVSQAMSIYSNLSRDRPQQESTALETSLQDDDTLTPPSSDSAAYSGVISVGLDKGIDVKSSLADSDTARSSRRRARTVEKIPDNLENFGDVK